MTPESGTSRFLETGCITIWVRPEVKGVPQPRKPVASSQHLKHVSVNGFNVKAKNAPGPRGPALSQHAR